MAGLSENFHEGRNCPCSFQSWNGEQPWNGEAVVTNSYRSRGFTIGFMINSTHLDTYQQLGQLDFRRLHLPGFSTYLAWRRKPRTLYLFYTVWLSAFFEEINETRARFRSKRLWESDLLSRSVKRKSSNWILSAFNSNFCSILSRKKIYILNGLLS